MPRRPAKNHSRTQLAAQQQGLVSAYHDWFDEEQAAESLKTFHREGKGSHRPAHHIDYAFIPAAWTSRLVSVTVGTVADWVDGGLFDHTPLTIEVRDEDPIRP
jgi:endonuclease/exonuclease/phosphatase family metal-dependent hydrolase